MVTFGWFSSGRDQVAIDLFEAVCRQLDRGFIPGRLAFVFCDRAPGESPAADLFLAAVRARGQLIPQGLDLTPQVEEFLQWVLEERARGRRPLPSPQTPLPTPISSAWEGGACGPDFPG